MSHYHPCDLEPCRLTTAPVDLPNIVAHTLAGVAWVELDNSGEQTRMVLVGDLDTIRALAGVIPAYGLTRKEQT